MLVQRAAACQRVFTRLTAFSWYALGREETCTFWLKALVRGFKHCLLLCTSVRTEAIIWNMKSEGREVEAENNSKGNIELKGVKRNTKHIKEKSSKKKKTSPV